MNRQKNHVNKETNKAESMIPSIVYYVHIGFSAHSLKADEGLHDIECVIGSHGCVFRTLIRPRRQPQTGKRKVV